MVADPGGVRARPGHTEALVQLCSLAGLSPVGILCEVLADDGTMARGPELATLANAYDLPFVTVEELAAYDAETATGAEMPRRNQVSS